jgi:hypothetical protein
MVLDHTEVVRLKNRHAELTGWLKSAQRYDQTYGIGGNPETRQRHLFRRRTAEAELPVIEKKLVNAWGPRPGKEEVPY